MIKKQFLIDTSVIIDSPATNLFSLFQNGENDIYITEVVLQELDKHKISLNPEVNSAARSFFRAVDEKPFEEVKVGAKGSDKISKTILRFENMEPIEIFIINRSNYNLPSNVPNDSKILEVAKDYGMTLVTNDISFKVIAMGEGVNAETLKVNSVMSPENIDFLREFEVDEADIENFIKTTHSSEKKWNQVIINETKDGLLTGRKQYFIVNGSGLIKIRSESEDFKELIVKPHNLEQKFYAEMLQLPFKIMAVTGSTGSGKTLMAIQEAIRKVKDPESLIDGVIYMRYTVNTNDKHAELGFRSGDESQKLGYFNYPLYSAINFIIEKDMERKNHSKKAMEEASKSGINKNEYTEKFMQDHNIIVADIAHARGITLSNKVVIFDEVQNAPNSILQLIGTRIGKNAPIILMGDFRQVDHPYLSKNRNALVSLLRLAENDPMVAAIQLKQTVRSEVAEWFQENVK
jgi:PhoH-like ATPase